MKPNLKLLLLGSVAAVALLGAVVTSAAGPNLLQNGDFSQGTDHWQITEPSAVLQASNGELSITTTAHSASSWGFGAAQCVDGISELHEYHLTGDMRIPAGQSRSGQAGFWVFAHDGPNCTGNSSGAWGPGMTGVVDSWVFAQHTFVPPDGTRSLEFHLYGYMAEAEGNDDPQGEFTVMFHNMSLSQGNQVKDEPRSIRICSQLLPNGDANEDYGIFAYDVSVDGQPPFLMTGDDLGESSDGPSCVLYDLRAFGVEDETSFRISQYPYEPFDYAPGYPEYDAGSGFVSGSEVMFEYPKGYGGIYTVYFQYMAAFDAPPPPVPDPPVDPDPVDEPDPGDDPQDPPPPPEDPDPVGDPQPGDDPQDDPDPADDPAPGGDGSDSGSDSGDDPVEDSDPQDVPSADPANGPQPGEDTGESPASDSNPSTAEPDQADDSAPGTAPLPPSTGTGRVGQKQGNALPLLGLALAMGVTASSLVMAGAREARKK